MITSKLLGAFLVVLVLTMSSSAQTTGWFYEIQNGQLQPVQITVPPDNVSQIVVWSSTQATQIPVYLGFTSANLPSDGQYDYLDVTDCQNEFAAAENVWSSNSGFVFSSQSQTQGSVVVVFIDNTDIFYPSPNGEAEGMTPLAVYNNKIVVAPPTGDNSQSQFSQTVIYFNGTSYANRGFYWTVNEYQDPNDPSYPNDSYMFFQNAAEHEIGHLGCSVLQLGNRSDMGRVTGFLLRK